MAASIPASESAYFYATYDRSGEALRGCKSMIINGTIMPVRSNSAIMEVAAKRCKRGEDVMFLAEAVATRNAIAPVTNGAPAAGTLAMTTEIKASRLSDIESCIASQWSAWAVLGDVNYSGFTGVNFGTTRISASSLVSRLKTEIGFANGVGTKNPSIGNFHGLRQQDMESLFEDITKKQCCVIPLTGASYYISGGATGPGNSILADYAEMICNNPAGQSTVGPRYANSVLVEYTFPPAASGSRVMLFAITGGDSWTAKDYPHDQEEGEQAFCLVPTDGAWHEVGEHGYLSATINAQTMLNTVVATCNFDKRFPTAPPDDDPYSTKIRQARWSYYLSSSLEGEGQRSTTFFALFDLRHTNLRDVIFRT